MVYLNGEFILEINNYLDPVSTTIYAETLIGAIDLDAALDINVWAIASSGTRYGDAAVGLLGNKVKLEWSGSSSADVVKYEVYTDNGTGTIDFNTVVATIDAITGDEI